ncbi:MAG TPA: hypothetical protein VLW17_01140 [Thermoanaerobaculaceae bacterium]|nr:hypothetical protein [Thermoanaerobaculaceae bacterium]
MRRLALLLPIAALLIACGMQDSTTPVPQPDSLILGRIAAIRDVAGEGGVKEVEIRAGLPEQMAAAMRRDGKFVPQLENDVAVKVRVTDQSVCVANLRAVDLDAFRVGQEVAVVPAGGTSAMVGSKLVLADAAELYQFSAYQLRFLPRSLDAVPAAVFSPSDPARINSAGVETTPLPVRGGRVIYFAAGLLPPLPMVRDAKPVGAVRPGMTEPSGAVAPWAVGGFRPYRTAWGKAGWEAPRPVDIPGIAPAEPGVRITWVNEAETSCLVEVTKADGTRSLLSSERASDAAPWGKAERVALATGPSVGDGQRLGLKLLSLVWTVYDSGSSDLWFSKEGLAGQRLDPRIDTLGPEFAPRVGPNNVLYFCRGDRQLLYAGGVVQEVRLPGAQRHPLLDAAPSADGTRIFFRVPRYMPGSLGWDLAVAEKSGKAWGQPVMLDDWRPE